MDPGKQPGEPDSDPLTWAMFRAAENVSELQIQLDLLAKGHTAIQYTLNAVAQWKNAQAKYNLEKGELNAADAETAGLEPRC